MRRSSADRTGTRIFSSAKLKLGLLVRFFNEAESLARAGPSRWLVLLLQGGLCFSTITEVADVCDKT